MQSTLPLSARTPALQVLRLIMKTVLLNQADLQPVTPPAAPRVGAQRVLPPYLAEMGYEIKYHLARVEPWLRNGWKIVARRPEFYPPGSVVEAPQFLAACDAIMDQHAVFGAGAGIFAANDDNHPARLEVTPGMDAESIEVSLKLNGLQKLTREAVAEIRLRQQFLYWLDYEGRPLTDYDRNLFAFSETCVAEVDLRRAEGLRPSYLPAAFESPPEPTAPHVGVQIRAVKQLSVGRNSDPAWMAAAAAEIGAQLGLPVLVYGHPDGCVIPEGLNASWRPAQGGQGHLARELGYLKSCRLMLGPDSGWTDLMAWLGIPVLLEKLEYSTAFEDLRGSFQPRIALVDHAAPLGPQVDALMASAFCLPTSDPAKAAQAKAMFPWGY